MTEPIALTGPLALRLTLDAAFAIPALATVVLALAWPGAPRASLPGLLLLAAAGGPTTSALGWCVLVLGSRGGQGPLRALVIALALVGLARVAATTGWSAFPVVWPSTPGGDAGVLALGAALHLASRREAGPGEIWAAALGGALLLARAAPPQPSAALPLAALAFTGCALAPFGAAPARAGLALGALGMAACLVGAVAEGLTLALALGFALAPGQRGAVGALGLAALAGLPLTGAGAGRALALEVLRGRELAWVAWACVPAMAPLAWGLARAWEPGPGPRPSGATAALLTGLLLTPLALAPLALAAGQPAGGALDGFTRLGPSGVAAALCSLLGAAVSWRMRRP